jgi:hypothetical protein
MTMHRVFVLLLLALAGIAWAQEDERAAPDDSKKELLRRIEALEPKLPNELARKLVTISMKIATGWCSPYLAKEFEAEVDKIRPGERRRFEKEWKLVREHEAWPGRAADTPSREK